MKSFLNSRGQVALEYVLLMLVITLLAYGLYTRLVEVFGKDLPFLEPLIKLENDSNYKKFRVIR